MYFAIFLSGMGLKCYASFQVYNPLPFFYYFCKGIHITMKKEDHIALYSADFILEIKQIVAQARQKAYSAINSAMVEAYWQMGKRIVEQEQQGQERAGYGMQLIKALSEELTREFGKGFSVPSLYNYRSFYLTFPEIFSTPWRILTWSHYKRLLTVPNAEARAWYLKEAAEQMWSYRTLDRNIGSQYYERLLLSQHKENVVDEMLTHTKPFEQDHMEFNLTIGIVLCSETDEDIARYSVLHDNDRLFASKYMLYMPTEEELRKEIERQKTFFRLQYENSKPKER